MLAQNFMTAGALGLTDEERAAHVVVLGMLEREEFIDREFEAEDQVTEPGQFFHMGTSYMHHCGTAACIGGWVAILMGHPDPRAYVNSFMPQLFSHQSPNWRLTDLYWGFTGAPRQYQAAQALRNFLTTGAPHWEEVLA